MSIILSLLVASASGEPGSADRTESSSPEVEATTESDSTAQRTRKAATPDYRIGSGDTVQIVVHGESDAFGQTAYMVDGSGRVSFPYVGQIDIGEMTPFEAEKEVRKQLSDGFIHNPEVTVQVTSFNSQRVDLLGAVQQPGVYSLEGPTTLRALLAKAGGIEADQSNGYVTVTRGDKATSFAVADIDGSAGSTVLQGGDVVEVDQGVNVFMAGEVANPGAVAYTEGLTASQALLMAGGGTDFSRLSGSYVVRGKERIQINLKRVLRGKDSDLQLEPGDRVVVPISAL